MNAERSSAAAQDAPRADPWAAVSYLITGIALWGGVGWLVDQWLDTTLFVVVGLLVGMASAIYLVYVRFGRA